MIDSDLIDVESLDFSDEQTWLYAVPNDSGQAVDIVDWNISCDWPINEDDEYIKAETGIYSLLDNILKNDVVALPDKHKFDSRTYVKPKRRSQRPSIQSIVEVSSNPSSLTQPATKYLTYNKYSMPLGPVSPMLRLKTFNVDTNTENSTVVKEYSVKRRSLVQDDDPQLEDNDMTLVADLAERPADGRLTGSKPISIDLSQPAHNLHNTFNKGLLSLVNERGSMNMYQSGESLMRMSPPSLVSSILMDNSGNFNSESLDMKKSLPPHKDPGVAVPARDSLDPMMTSMTLSILDEKDMSTSFLSQTTYPDNDSFLDSLPPSLVGSVNSSSVMSNTSKPKTDGEKDINIFSSPTYTHLEHAEKLLSARPRLQPFNTFTRRESAGRKFDVNAKPPEIPPQFDTGKVLNENTDKKDSPKTKPNPDMSETITLHFSNKFHGNSDAEKENLNETFEKDNAFLNDSVQRLVDLGRNSLNVTLDKQELNAIIQARQKLSVARRSFPSEPEKPLPNQVPITSPKAIPISNQTIMIPRQSMENASELLSRRKITNGSIENHEEPRRDTPKRNATFKKPSPKANPPNLMDTTVVYVNNDDNHIIDINSATMNLIDGSENNLQHQKWSSQERAMVGSNESTDTGTFSSSSPPESVPDTGVRGELRPEIASTPLMTFKKASRDGLMNAHTTISPIYDLLDGSTHKTGDCKDHNATVVNNGSPVRKNILKRDILAERTGVDKRHVEQILTRKQSAISTASHGMAMAPPTIVRKTGLPTSKLRQYSSHKELSRIPSSGSSGTGGRSLAGRLMTRRAVYASNPALSPTAPTPPTYPLNPAPPTRRDSYIIVDRENEEEKNRPYGGTNPAVSAPAPATLIRQGTETLRRERPQSQLVAPRDPPTTRPYSVASAGQLRVTRPSSAATTTTITAPVPASRPLSGACIDSAREVGRVSALPRPSRLPAPRRSIRPPSVYSVATGSVDTEHY